jgi:hypothetical protein
MASAISTSSVVTVFNAIHSDYALEILDGWRSKGVVELSSSLGPIKLRAHKE